MSVYFGNKKVSPLIVQSKQQTNTEVQLALAGGNQDVIAPNGYLYYKVTIVKPDTLVSNNIRKGVTIAGVIGTMEEQKEEEEKTINITANNTYAVVPTEGKTLSKVTAVVTVSPTLQSKSVTPSTTQQIVTSDDGYQGLSQVIVYKAPTETIEITPTKEVQTKQPSDGKVGYSEVTVKPIPDNYIIPSGTLEITGNGTYNVTDKASAVVNVPTSSGTELNIHYGDTAPEDTSKLWIKSEKPSNISFPVVWKPEQIVEGITDTDATLSMKLSGIAAAAVGTKIYLFGGMKSGSIGDSVNTIQVFDATNNTIQTLSTTLPMKLSRSGVAAVGTKIYLFGGDSTRPSNLIQVFDTINNTIQTLSTTLSTTTYSIAAAAVGTKIYLFGGYFNNLDIIQVFDTTNNTIQTLSTTLPMKMYDIAATAVGTKIYLFGGDSNSGSLDIIQVFDATNNTIQTLSTTLPMELCRSGVAAVGTKIYLFGGFGGWYEDLIQVFDTINNTIQTLSTTLPTEMCFIAAAAVGIKIYLFGGMKSGGLLNTIYQFTDEVPLASNDIIVTQKDYSLTFTLLKPPTEVELGCKNVYKGDQSLAKFIDAYVYDGANWVNVNTNDVTFTKLYAPKISISDKTLTITNDGRNGSHVTNYKVYNGSTLLTTITTTTLDLTTVITANGTYNISVIATGTGYADSDSSNVVEYICIAPQLSAPNNLTVDGTIISWDAVENAESYDVYADDTALLGNTTGVAISYTITPTLTNVTAASGNATTIATDETKTLTYTAADGYVLPDTVTVTGATGVWNKDEGTLILSNPTGNVTFMIAGVEVASGYTLTVINSYGYETVNITYANGNTADVGAGTYEGVISINSIPGGYDCTVTDANDNIYYVPYTLTSNTTINVWACLIEGTQITLADGTTKAIEDITYDDELLVWNFYEGKFDKAKPTWIKVAEVAPRYNLVKFSNGAEVGFVGAGEENGYHRIFNKEAGAFTYTGNFKETPNGTTTFAQDGTFPTVVSQEVVEKEVKFYNVITDKHYNLFANGILTSCKLSNKYRIEDMRYIGERLISDEQEKAYFDKLQNKKQ